MAKTVRELPAKQVAVWKVDPAGLPFADGFVECARYTVPSGKVALVDVQQEVVVNNGGGGSGLFRVAGLAWHLKRTDVGGKNPVDVPLQLNAATQKIFRNDGPIAQNLLFTEGQTISWGVDVVAAQVQANVIGLGGGILALELDATMDAREALPLLRR